MKSFTLLIISFFMYFSSYCQSRDYRAVILFYPQEKVDSASKQLRIFSSDLSGLSARQIKIERVATDSKDFELYSAYKINQKLFTLLLIGKDGGIKYSSNKTINSAKLYSLIDQMPMRKQEMKKQDK